MLDVGPEHLHCLYLISSEYEPFISVFQTKSMPELVEAVPHPPDQDQHYRDDLRAGAFQFVDAVTGSSQEDLPLPYQVVFWQAPPTMAWRYPQPRALTHVDIFPVPFKVQMHRPFSHCYVLQCDMCYHHQQHFYGRRSTRPCISKDLL